MKLIDVSRELNIPIEKLKEWVENYEWLNPDAIGEKQIEIIKRIRELERNGYTLAGIRRRLIEEFGPPADRSILLRIREELRSLLTFLRSDDNII